MVNYKGKFDNLGAGCVIRFADELLLIKRARYPWTDFYATVTGLLQKGEDPVSRIKIEATEEVGLKVSKNIRRLKGSPYFTYSEDYRASFFLHMYEGIASNKNIKRDTREVAEARWFTASEIISAKSELAPVTKQILFDFGIKDIKPDKQDLQYLARKGL